MMQENNMNDSQIEEARIRAMNAYADKEDAMDIAKERELEVFRDYIEVYLHQLSAAVVRFSDREILSGEELRGILMEDLEAVL